MLLALLLMLGDHHQKTVHRIRISLSTVVLPLQYAVNWPIDFINQLTTDLSSKKELRKENTQLRAQVLLLNAVLQKQYAIESENQQLHALLQSHYQENNYRVFVAQLLAISTQPFVREVQLNRGINDGVFVGQPVLDAWGIMGQVIEAGPYTSWIMFITDPRSAVPVQIRRTGIRAMLIGNGNQLKLINITQTKDIQVGDELVTSGLGGRYPFGYPVGTVAAIQNDPGEPFADITILPAAHLNQSRLVLLLEMAPVNLPTVQTTGKTASTERVHLKKRGH